MPKTTRALRKRNHKSKRTTVYNGFKKSSAAARPHRVRNGKNVLKGDVMTALFNAVVMREGCWYVAKCPENSVTSQGKTIEEALDNLKEALALYYENDAPPDDSPRALLTTVEVSV